MPEEKQEQEVRGAAKLIYGIELRDLFAGFALSAALYSFPEDSPERTAKLAYEYADAMLKARQK